MIRPVQFIWTDEGVMKPLPRFKTLCDRQYAVGEEYALGPIDNIPSKSRAGFFVDLHNAWSTMQEGDNRFPSETHLRKRALIAAGWATHTQTVLDTPKDAQKSKIMLNRVEEYALVTIGGCVVDVWIAKSIANGQITAEQWRVVKPKALAWIAEQANTTVEDLQNFRKAQQQDAGGST